MDAQQSMTPRQALDFFGDGHSPWVYDRGTPNETTICHEDGEPWPCRIQQAIEVLMALVERSEGDQNP